MKISRILFITSLLMTVNATLLALPNGKELFVSKCASCHYLEFPEKRSQLKASPLPGMMFQLNHNIYSDEKIIAFIKDFVLNPNEDKIVFNRTRKFGFMPSQRGKITEEELSIVAEWMVENIYMTRKEYKDKKLKMKRSGSK